MFYSSDILSRRQHGFGVFWLAATLGSKGGTSFKKLTRKEVLGCNLVEACERLASPEEPLALRLSSNLLCGIARVYQQQYTIWQADVSHVHQMLKKAITEVFKSAVSTTAPDDDQSGTQRKDAISAQAITLAMNPTLALLGWDRDYAIGVGDWSAFTDLPDGTGELEFGSGVEKDMSFGSPQIGREPTGAHQARDLADITLQEPLVDDYIYQGDASVHFGDELGDFQLGEHDVGLLEGASPELDAVLREGSAAARSRASSGRRYGALGGAGSSSMAGGDNGFGAFDDYYVDPNADGANRFEIPDDFDFGAAARLEDQVRQEHEEGQAMRDELGQPVARASSVLDPDQGFMIGDDLPSSEKRKSEELEQDEEEEAAAAAAVAAQKRKKRKTSRKRKTIAVDDDVSMPDNKEVRMRQNYGERMREERDKADRARSVKEKQNEAMTLVFDVPEGFGGPLADLWKQSVTNRLPRLGEGRAAADKKKRKARALAGGDKTPSSPDSLARKKLRGDSEQRAESELDVAKLNLGRFAMTPDPNEINFEIGQGDGGYGAQYDDMYQDQYQEVGRAGSQGALTGSQARVSYPWNAEVATSDVGAGFGPLGGGASSQGGTAARVSLDTPLRGRDSHRSRSRSRTGSLVPSLYGSAQQAGATGLGFDGFEEFGGFDDAGQARDDDGQGHEGSQGRASQDGDVITNSNTAEHAAKLEQDSLKFLSYITRLKTQAQAESQTQSQPGGASPALFFSDIVPIASTTTQVAAAAFYHLLALASGERIGVEQEGEFGEIRVEIKA